MTEEEKLVRSRPNNAAYMRKWYAENSEKKSEYHKAYYEEHKEEIKKKNKDRYEKTKGPPKKMGRPRKYIINKDVIPAINEDNSNSSNIVHNLQ
jgi:hypothetical protein